VYVDCDNQTGVDDNTMIIAVDIMKDKNEQPGHREPDSTKGCGRPTWIYLCQQERQGQEEDEDAGRQKESFLRAHKCRNDLMDL